MTTRYRARFPLVALGILALLAGLWTGLVRLGWGLPLLWPTLPTFHGPLMISGFLGTLIGLERAAGLGYRWTYTIPLLSGVGALVLMLGLSLGLPSLLGPLLMTLGSLGLVAIFVVIIRRQLALFTATMGIGALSWLIGNVLWVAGWPIYRIVLWWAGFLVLTIAGERLGSARLLRLSGVSRAAFVVAISLFLSGLILTGVDFSIGVRLAGVGMIALTLWLMRHDIAQRTVRQEAGLPRFIAICLLSGYVWLGASGLLGLLLGGVVAGPHYDAMLHALFLGFVFTMIFGHAPIIFPAVLGLPISFQPTFYAHLALLHLTLVLRVAGDLMHWLPGHQWGGLLNVLVLLLFLVNTGYAIQKSYSINQPVE